MSTLATVKTQMKCCIIAAVYQGIHCLLGKNDIQRGKHNYLETITCDL